MIVRVFNLSNKDAIRIAEQKHESELKKLLQQYEIKFKPSKIKPFGTGWSGDNDKKKKTVSKKVINKTIKQENEDEL